jgi:hypothetical protein
VSISAVALHLRGPLRAHFLEALARTHPELAADLERRYRGAYLPKADQRDLSERVGAFVHAARARQRPGRRRTKSIRTGDGDVERATREQGLGPGRPTRPGSATRTRRRAPSTPEAPAALALDLADGRALPGSPLDPDATSGAGWRDGHRQGRPS